MHDWLGNSFKAQDIDKSRCSTGRSTVRDGRRAWGKTNELFWRMNTEVQLLKEVQKFDNYEDAEMSFDFDWTYARMDAMKMELDGAEKGSKQEF